MLKKPAKAPKNAFEMKAAIIESWNALDKETKQDIVEIFNNQMTAYDLFMQQFGEIDSTRFISLVLSYGMQSVMEGVKRIRG